MKKLSTLFLSVCILIVFSVPIASAAELPPTPNPTPNERVLNLLKENNIDYKIVDGNIKLDKTSEEAIADVNKLLSSQSQFSRSSITATSYPTSYIHMVQYDITDSKKFTAATKTAFTVAFTAYAKNITTPWQELVAVAVGGFATYYFINTTTEDLYTFIRYYFRELGPGFFDMNGTFIGDYEILKKTRVTKYSNGTGGSYATDARRSTIIEPWF
ncbi:hypothetical protein J2Z22_004254 [Paenibacillus forsythiae]|uniref:Uncharacterized protein n=1 Tax=Paenibacillus forsythiae TaxID=365616 RepID=A0ABU3HCY1_9BACL|nr:hypothetical protein [Paenibacillus forsythiae]MDT3428661.1 hypothetical protein [Paenibacillus forsythiae]